MDSEVDWTLLISYLLGCVALIGGTIGWLFWAVHRDDQRAKRWHEDLLSGKDPEVDKWESTCLPQLLRSAAAASSDSKEPR